MSDQWTLIDIDDLIEMFQSLDRPMLAWFTFRSVERDAESWRQNIGHERTLTAAAHPSHANEATQWNRNVDPFKLLWDAFRISSFFPFPGRRTSGDSILSRPLR